MGNEQWQPYDIILLIELTKNMENVLNHCFKVSYSIWKEHLPRGLSDTWIILSTWTGITCKKIPL